MSITEKPQEYLHELGNDQEIIDRVLDWFRVFASVPHGSGNEKAISDLLAQKFKALGWAVEQDQYNNLKADIPGAPGFEHLPPVILQGHMDMVCAVAEGSGYVPARDPITIVIEDGILRSDRRSSLGADCGLGLSLAFTVAEKELQRGPIRLILTVSEETSLNGAKVIDPAWLQGCKWMINVDAGSTRSIVVSCASGRGETFTRPMEYAPCCVSHSYELILNGLKGGHSGGAIHLGRGNALKLLVQFLAELKEQADYELAALQGGLVGNAIPTEARATVAIEDDAKLREAVALYRDRIKNYYKNIDPNVTIELREVPLPEQVWSKQLRDDAITLLSLLHHGPFAMHDTIPGHVNTSANVAVCRIDEAGNLFIKVSVRSHELFPRDMLTTKHTDAARLTGFHAEILPGYPGYAGDPKNPLALLVDRVCQRQGGAPMSVIALHVGLELGILADKNPDLTVISVGPDARDAHTVTEQAPLNRFPIYARLLAGSLEELAKCE